MKTNSANKQVFLSLAQAWMDVMLPRLRPTPRTSVSESTSAELEFAGVVVRFWMRTHKIPDRLFDQMENEAIAENCIAYMRWSWKSRFEQIVQPFRPEWLGDWQ